MEEVAWGNKNKNKLLNLKIGDVLSPVFNY